MLHFVLIGLALLRAPLGVSQRPQRSAPPVLKSKSDLSFSRQTATNDGGPLLLFLPGIDGTGGAGATQWPRVAPMYEVHSFSFGTEDRSSFTECVEACNAFLEKEPQRATLLVGESTGAVLALGIALRSPSLVNALCLVNPATSYNDSPLSALAPLLPRLPRPIYEAAPGFISPLFGRPNWFRTIVRAPPVVAPIVPLPSDILAAGAALADVLPPDALAHRLQAQLTDGAALVNAKLASPPAVKSLDGIATLLLAGGRDVILPSSRETSRLAGLLEGSRRGGASGSAAGNAPIVRKVLPEAAHACMDDLRSLNLFLELELAGISRHVQQAQRGFATAAAAAGAEAEPVVSSWYDAGLRLDGSVPEATTAAAAPAPTTARDNERAAVVDPSPQSLFEGWLGQMRRLFSPLFYHTSADDQIVRGLQGLPLPDGPVLLVGNHQLFGFDGPMILEELVRERGRTLRAMVFPPLLAETSPLAPFPYPLPGTKETFERFGATPVSARSLYKALAAGEAVLLFPGGAREVFKRKGEQYSLFWPDEPDFVRLAARVNATILPFAGIGGDESFTMALDSDEILAAPAIGDFFRERVDDLPSLVPGDKFVPPFGAITPQRHYFLFGRPLSTESLAADDREGCARVYADARAQVDRGMQRLRDEVRAEDDYRSLVPRTAWEAVYDAAAPGPARFET